MLGKLQHYYQPVNRLLDDMRLLVEELTFFSFLREAWLSLYFSMLF